MRRERHLANIEFACLQHALKGFARPHDCDLEINLTRANAPIDQWPCAVIIPTGEFQLKIRHSRRLRISWIEGFFSKARLRADRIPSAAGGASCRLHRPRQSRTTLPHRMAARGFP